MPLLLLFVSLGESRFFQVPHAAAQGNFHLLEIRQNKSQVGNFGGVFFEFCFLLFFFV